MDRLLETGHEPLVIAPGSGFPLYRSAPVVRVRSKPDRYASRETG